MREKALGPSNETARNLSDSGRLHGSGERIRTSDLRVMSPTSYQTALPRNKSARKLIAGG
jgi:hypothetical protein